MFSTIFGLFIMPAAIIILALALAIKKGGRS